MSACRNTDPTHGLAMLQAASMALFSNGAQAPLNALLNPAPPPPAPCCAGAAPPSVAIMTAESSMSLNALLNPAPVQAQLTQQQQQQQQQQAQPEQPLPPGYVRGADGKVRKKRDRKPTTGRTEEERRQARLLKNRRTAATSRRRRIEQLRSLTAERDAAAARAQRLQQVALHAVRRLAETLGTTAAKLVAEDAALDHPGLLDDGADADEGATTGASDYARVEPKRESVLPDVDVKDDCCGQDGLPESQVASPCNASAAGSDDELARVASPAASASTTATEMP